MARRKRNENPERQALREMMAGYLKDNPVKDGKDVNSIMREMMSVILEGTLDGELDDTLGYSKYDYKNKDTGNSRNGYSRKTMHTSYGDMDLDIPRDRNASSYKKISKYPYSRYGRKNHFYVCQRYDNWRYREPFKRFIWH